LYAPLQTRSIAHESGARRCTYQPHDFDGDNDTTGCSIACSTAMVVWQQANALRNRISDNCRLHRRLHPSPTAAHRPHAESHRDSENSHRDLPESSRDLPESSRDLPESSRDLSESSRETDHFKPRDFLFQAEDRQLCCTKLGIHAMNLKICIRNFDSAVESVRAWLPAKKYSPADPPRENEHTPVYSMTPPMHPTQASNDGSVHRRARVA